jgi:hypothetical protein
MAWINSGQVIGCLPSVKTRAAASRALKRVSAASWAAGWAFSAGGLDCFFFVAMVLLLENGNKSGSAPIALLD